MHKSFQLSRHKDAEIFLEKYVFLFLPICLIEFWPSRWLTYIPKGSNYRLSGNYQLQHFSRKDAMGQTQTQNGSKNKHWINNNV